MLPSKILSRQCLRVQNSVLNKCIEKKIVFRIRETKLSRSEIVKSANTDFKNRFHSVNRPKETFRLTS